MTRRTQWLVSAFLSAGFAAALPMASQGQISPQPQQSPLAAARKQISDARAQIIKTKAALDKARVRVESNFGKENPGYATAQKAYEKALLDVKNTTATALTSLNKKPEYVEAVKAKQAAKDKQAALQADSKASNDDLQSAFNDVLAQAKIVSDMENTVTQSDPRIADAKQRLSDAKQNLDDFKSKIDAACAADPEYQQAQSANTAAEQTLASAEASFQQQQKDAYAAAAKSRAPTPAGQPRK